MITFNTIQDFVLYSSAILSVGIALGVVITVQIVRATRSSITVEGGKH